MRTRILVPVVVWVIVAVAIVRVVDLTGATVAVCCSQTCSPTSDTDPRVLETDLCHARDAVIDAKADLSAKHDPLAAPIGSQTHAGVLLSGAASDGLDCV
jgi:hypothetical protein